MTRERSEWMSVCEPGSEGRTSWPSASRGRQTLHPEDAEWPASSEAAVPHHLVVPELVGSAFSHAVRGHSEAVAHVMYLIRRRTWLALSPTTLTARLFELEGELRETRRQLAGHRQRIAELEHRVAIHEQLAGTVDRVGGETEATPTALGWIDSHPAELAAHEGRHVAIHPVEGIVASSETFDGLCDLLDTREVGDEVTLYRVPIGILDEEPYDGRD